MPGLRLAKVKRGLDGTSIACSAMYTSRATARATTDVTSCRATARAANAVSDGATARATSGATAPAADMGHPFLSNDSVGGQFLNVKFNDS